MEHHDAISQKAEVDAAIAAELTAGAVSRLRASELKDPPTYPSILSFAGTSFGVLITTEHGSHLVATDAPIQPGDVIRRLLHPLFNTLPLAGSC